MGTLYASCGRKFSFRRKLFSAVCCLIVVAPWVTAAEKNAAGSTPSIRQTRSRKSCVWRVVNSKAPFYLVGSVHALTQKDYPLPSGFETALNNSNRLVFEYNPDQDEEFQKKLAAAGKYPTGQDIRNRIHPQTLSWLRNNTRYVSTDYDASDKRYHENLKDFDAALQYRPWWIADHMFDIRAYSDITDQNGVDAWFENRGRKTGKEFGGIETIDEHVAVLGGLSDRDGEILLLDALVYMDQIPGELYRTRSAWRRGDVEKLWVLDARLRREAPWIAARLLDVRNAKWVPKIMAEMKSGKPTAIIVGALHFGGPNGLLSLLQRQGCVLEQL